MKTTLLDETFRLFVCNRICLNYKRQLRCSICKGLFGIDQQQVIYIVGNNNLVTHAAGAYFGLDVCDNTFLTDNDTSTILLHDWCLNELLPNMTITKLNPDLSALFQIRQTK